MPGLLDIRVKGRSSRQCLAINSGRQRQKANARYIGNRSAESHPIHFLASSNFSMRGKVQATKPESDSTANRNSQTTFLFIPPPNPDPFTSIASELPRSRNTSSRKG